MYIRQTPILEDAMWMKSSLHPYEKNKNVLSGDCPVRGHPVRGQVPVISVEVLEPWLSMKIRMASSKEISQTE